MAYKQKSEDLSGITRAMTDSSTYGPGPEKKKTEEEKQKEKETYSTGQKRSGANKKAKESFYKEFKIQPSAAPEMFNKYRSEKYPNLFS